MNCAGSTTELQRQDSSGSSLPGILQLMHGSSGESVSFRDYLCQAVTCTHDLALQMPVDSEPQLQGGVPLNANAVLSAINHTGRESLSSTQSARLNKMGSTALASVANSEVYGPEVALNGTGADIDPRDLVSLISKCAKTVTRAEDEEDSGDAEAAQASYIAGWVQSLIAAGAVEAALLLIEETTYSEIGDETIDMTDELKQLLKQVCMCSNNVVALEALMTPLGYAPSEEADISESDSDDY